MEDCTGVATERCFGQRMFNPFRGVMHTVTTRWADAVTTDGRNWTLYVRGECLYDDPTALEQAEIKVPDVKFATWSTETGLRRAPIRLPTFDARVRAEGEHLLAAVMRRAPELPFPLADRFELWLTHAGTGLPLALIGSHCAGDPHEPPVAARWTPGRACLAQLPEARQLHAAITALAGREPRAVWFERRADGSGRALTAEALQPGSGDAQRLPDGRFATLFVDPEALMPEQREWLTAVHHWQAPALLQLPGLAMAQRAALEREACRHAERVAEQLPLYPQVLDRAAITAALVEARLRRTGGRPSAKVADDNNWSPDYLEIPE
ncbi:MAG: hypothetical protein KDJ33_19380 [Gammaproteobacteria bacterium]|nr:hypothetical protein [Gammaproteobacteria bacterium]